LPPGAGADPREDGDDAAGYLAIKDARATARLAERDALAAGDPDAEPLSAGARAWSEVAEGGAALLAERAKDLQVAAWLCEAWLRLHGFPGLAAGFALMAGLVDRYWDDGLYPLEDEEGAETRVAPLFGLFGRGEAGTLLQPIKLLPLSDRGGEPVALWTVENAQAQSTRHDDPDVREGLVARRQQRIAAIDDAIAKASPEFAAEAIGGITAALAELDALMAAIDERAPFGRFGTQVARPLQDALQLLSAAHRVPDEDAADEVVEADEPTVGTAAEPVPTRPREATRSAAMTRDTALATLLDIAAFFDRNEPQSMVGLGLREIVRRAEMPLEGLLRELLPEDDQRTLFLMRAGIKAAPPEDGYSSY